MFSAPPLDCVSYVFRYVFHWVFSFYRLVVFKFREYYTILTGQKSIRVAIFWQWVSGLCNYGAIARPRNAAHLTRGDAA